LILGEHNRALDDRFRLSLPSEVIQQLSLKGDKSNPTDVELVLVKEQPGCLSLWKSADWKVGMERDLESVKAKLVAGRLKDRQMELQRLGRMLSTRHKEVKLAGRGRLLVPEGFREFLGVDAGGEVMVVGAAVCIEIWRADAWLNQLSDDLPQFQDLLEELIG
jgi:MraZ protein